MIKTFRVFFLLKRSKKMKPIKVMSVFGVRPEAIKMAPLILELQRHPQEIESIVCVTAQHRELLDQVMHTFNIQADYDLNVMKDKQTLQEITVRVLQGLEPVFKESKPDIILVHGDTLTTFLASYAAFMQQIKVGHIEAGLRTWNKHSPYPEEVNRQLTGVIADVHFAPTRLSADNLRRENKAENSIYITGNTVTDVPQYTVSKNYTHPLLDWAKGKRLIILTAHRRESQGEPHKQIFRAIKRIADEFTDIAIVFPVHPNPAVSDVAHEILGAHPRIKLVSPLDVFDLYNFYPHTHLILTDSGGIQEEAPAFGVPVLVLRETTERPEGVEAGTLELVGTNENRIYERTKVLLTDDTLYQKMSQTANPYGDGQASLRIVKGIIHHFDPSQAKPESF
jgi:UDP-N-acetylglucosamine 2-epimerase (non-hydrolysing)